jgi:hypothetical protein
MARGTQARIVELVRTRRPDLIVLTDDVYGTFTEGFRSLAADLPRNTILVYSYSKHFGCTGWRLGVVGVHQDNVLDEQLAKLPAGDRQALRERYASLTTDPYRLRFISVLAVNSGQAVYQVLTEGPVWSLIISCLIVSAVPALVAWWIGRHVLKLNPALLMGAIAGARQNTSSMQAAQELTRSAVPGIGYPVPLAITTVALSIVAYFFALFV